MFTRIERNMGNPVALSPLTSLPDAEKLNVLRRLDQFRQWHWLDDNRYCLVCGKIITGHQIQVAGGNRGNGCAEAQLPLRLLQLNPDGLGAPYG